MQACFNLKIKSKTWGFKYSQFVSMFCTNGVPLFQASKTVASTAPKTKGDAMSQVLKNFLF